MSLESSFSRLKYALSALKYVPGIARSIRQMLANFLELNSKTVSKSRKCKKKSHCLVFTYSTKREIRHFHVVVVQRQQRNVQKSVAKL